jgi:hypothetical protein
MHLQNLQKYGGVAAMAKIEEGGKVNNRVSFLFVKPTIILILR